MSLDAVRARVAQIENVFSTMPGRTVSPSSSRSVRAASFESLLEGASPTGPTLSTASTRPDNASPASEVLPPRASAWTAEIARAADRNGLDRDLLTALVWTESGFDAEAVSSAGAIGLAQLMPDTASQLGVDPRDPTENLDGGARFLAAQLDRFVSTDVALAAYNAGPGRVARTGGIPNIPETQRFVDLVLERYDRLRAEGDA